MGHDFSSIAFPLRAALAEVLPPSSTPLKLTHLHQLLAAALGYKTHAGYQTARTAGIEAEFFDDVTHVVLDQDLLAQRLLDLGIAPVVMLTQSRLDKLLSNDAPATEMAKVLACNAIASPDTASSNDSNGESLLMAPVVAHSIARAFHARCPGTRVHMSEGDILWYAEEKSAERITESGAFQGQWADLNADSVDEFDLESEEITQFCVTNPGEPWVVDVQGPVYMTPRRDSAYLGRVINVCARVSFPKLGRRLLGNMDLFEEDITASIGSEPGYAADPDTPGADPDPIPFAPYDLSDLSDLSNLPDDEAPGSEHIFSSPVPLIDRHQYDI